MQKCRFTSARIPEARGLRYLVMGPLEPDDLRVRVNAFEKNLP